MNINFMLMTYGLLVFYGLILFGISIIKKDNGIADIGWGSGFVIISWFLFFLNPSILPHYILLAAVTIWGLRLSIRIYLRKKVRTGEDNRYKLWREEWGKNFYWRSYLQIYLLQPTLLFLNGFILILFFSNPNIMTSWIMFLGGAMWLIGFIFESLADYQLDYFYKNRSRTGKNFLDKGLWRYSRHPNYFGEVLLWWGTYFYVAPTIGWAAGAVSPIIITIIILFVSGIPMAESRRKKNPEYLKYCKSTSIFIPFLRKDSK